MGTIGNASVRQARPHDGRYAERRRLGALLAGGLAALALAVMLAPGAPALAAGAEGNAGTSAADAAKAAAAMGATAADDSRAANATGAAGSEAAGATVSKAPAASAAGGAGSAAASTAPALTVPKAVPVAAEPTPAEAPAAPAATEPTRPDASADAPTTADDAFITILYRTSPGTAGVVNPGENSVRVSDGAGLGGSTATPLRGYVCIGWYNGDEQVSPDATLTRDQALAGVNRTDDGHVAATTFIARFARPSASLSLTVALASEPANGSCFTEGETVTFRATVANTGNVPLSDVVLTSDEASFPAVGTLAPGQSRTEEWSRVVTADDVRAEALTCTVTAQGEAPAYGLTAEAGPESAAAAAGTLAAGQTYVLYGAHPADGGSVSRSVSIVESRDGAGLETVTAEPRPGWTFAGWYEDDARVSTDPTLTPETALGFLNRGRSAYAPTLFLAHFVREEPAPVTPDEPAGPDEPTTPDDPAGPDEPAKPDEPAAPVTPAVPGGDEPATPSEPTRPDGPDADVPGGDGAGTDASDGDGAGGDVPGDADNAAHHESGASDGAAPTAPEANDASATGAAAGSAADPDAPKATANNGLPSIPQTGDAAPALAALALVLVAAAAIVLIIAARRRHE